MAEDRFAAVKVPKWGMAMTQAKVVGWLKEVGDTVEQGEALLEIETDKAVNVMEAAITGTLVRKTADRGCELPVGGLLGVIAREAVDAAAVDAYVAEFQAAFVPEAEGLISGDAPQYVEIDRDVTLSFRKYRARRPGGDGPLVLVHGFGGTQEGWAQNVFRLSETHDLYTVDLPGHGASTKDVGDGTLESLAECLSLFMKAVGLPSAHLVGHSLGASALVSLAARAPAQVRSLTLISGLGAGTKIDESYIREFLLADRRKSLTICMQKLFANPTSISRKMVENVLKTKRVENAASCLNSIAEAAILGPVDTDPVSTLSRLRSPLQVIWGEADQVSPANQLDRVPKTIPCTVVKNAGHMVHMEAAREVDDLVTSFVTGRALNAELRACGRTAKD